MRLLAVLDVNTLASAAASDTGLPGKVVDLATEGVIGVAVSEVMLRKLDDVLQRPYFWRRLSAPQRQRFIAAYRAVARRKDPDLSVTGVAEDEEDDLVLGTAVAAEADYLITGDAGLLAIDEYRGVRIITARQFLLLIDAG